MAGHPRVVSLLPAATEIVCALGLEDSLVGRSHECDYPATVQGIPVLTSTCIDSAGSSGRIDSQVKASLGESSPLYQVDAAKLQALHPDIIITQSQCGVCAVSAEQIELGSDAGPQARRVDLKAQRLADLWTDIQNVADALEASTRGRNLIRDLKRRCVAVIEQACQVEDRPTVVCLEWLDPLMASGNWVPELIDLAGGQDLCGEPGQHSDWLSWDKLRGLDPEILILMPCGFDLARTGREWTRLRPEASWEKLQAVQENQVYLTDGNQFFNRPGPRLIDSLEILANILHPELFKPRHQGTGWVRSE